MSASIVETCELICWRRRRARLDLALQELLRLKGDTAEPELIKLQHDLTELGQPPFGARTNQKQAAA